MVDEDGHVHPAELWELFAKVGSYYPVCENFRLTPEVKARFTKRLKTGNRE
jgi:hypothetical protein